MSIWLVMKTADGGERPFPVRERVVIGRNTRCEVRIALPVVSEQHCELRVEDGKLHALDLKSEHGTFHNGSRITRTELADTDVLTVGPVTFEVRMGQRPASTVDASQPDSVTEINVVPQTRSTQPRP